MATYEHERGGIEDSWSDESQAHFLASVPGYVESTLQSHVDLYKHYFNDGVIRAHTDDFDLYADEKYIAELTTRGVPDVGRRYDVYQCKRIPERKKVGCFSVSTDHGRMCVTSVSGVDDESVGRVESLLAAEDLLLKTRCADAHEFRSPGVRVDEGSGPRIPKERKLRSLRRFELYDIASIVVYIPVLASEYPFFQSCGYSVCGVLTHRLAAERGGRRVDDHDIVVYKIVKRTAKHAEFDIVQRRL